MSGGMPTGENGDETTSREGMRAILEDFYGALFGDHPAPPLPEAFRQLPSLIHHSWPESSLSLSLELLAMPDLLVTSTLSAMSATSGSCLLRAWYQSMTHSCLI